MRLSLLQPGEPFDESKLAKPSDWDKLDVDVDIKEIEEKIDKQLDETRAEIAAEKAAKEAKKKEKQQQKA